MLKVSNTPSVSACGEGQTAFWVSFFVRYCSPAMSMSFTQKALEDLEKLKRWVTLNEPVTTCSVKFIHYRFRHPDSSFAAASSTSMAKTRLSTGSRRVCARRAPTGADGMLASRMPGHRWPVDKAGAAGG